MWHVARATYPHRNARLVAHDYGMNATCERCRYRADLDMRSLIDKLGEGFISEGMAASLPPAPRCPL
jgi:hypothetical protein